MDDAGQGEQAEKRDAPETVEDATARFLAAGFSPGVMWWADAPDAHLDTFTDAGPERNLTVLRVAAHDETEELASRYLTRDKRRWPTWLSRTTVETQDAVKAWSANHRMSVKRGGPIGEFTSWKHGGSFGAAPRRQGSYKGAIALADAKLAGPLEPLLRLYGLQDVSCWPLVLTYCRKHGLDSDACEVAIRRILFTKGLWTNADDHAQTIGRRGRQADTFRKQVNAAECVLREWLHDACQRFLSAHGWTPQTYVEKPIALARMPKRARPRFESGIDWATMPPPHAKDRRGRKRIGTGIPAPVRTMSALWAAVHPAQPRLSLFYHALDDDRITRGHDYWGRERAREVRQAA